MEEVQDQDSPQQLSARSQSPLNSSIILKEAPTAVSHSSESGGNGNKNTTLGKVNVTFYWYIYDMLMIY
jgi:hypothetical protein